MAITLNAPSQVRPYANLAAFPVTGVLKTVYIAEDTNKIYRWTGSAYVELSETEATTWGSITGTLSAQTDLQTALDAKFDEPTGNATQYLDGAGAPTTFPTALPPSGTAGGDLTGTYPNPTVHRIHGIDIQNGTPSADDVLVYGGSPAKWQHQHLNASQVNNDSSVTGTSVELALEHLDSTKVPTTRTLTINGTTQDLSANRSWTIALATPTLDQVTTAGNTTANLVTVGALTINASITASGAIARGSYFNNTLIAAANNDVLVGLDILNTFTNGSFTGVANYNIRTTGLITKQYFRSPTVNQGNHTIAFGFGGAGEQVKFIASATGASGRGNLYIASVSGDTAVATTANANALFTDTSNTFYKSFTIEQSGLTSGNGLYLYGNQPNAITNGIYFRYGETRVAILSKPHGGNGYADFRIAIVPLGGPSTNNPPQESDTKFMITKDTTNVLINTTTDAGFKTDINGTARVVGLFTGTGGATISGSNTTISTSKTFINGISTTTSGFGDTGYGMAIDGGIRWGINAGNSYKFGHWAGLNGAFNWNNASASVIEVGLGATTPNVNNITWTSLNITPIFNVDFYSRTGNIVRGIYYNPTITSFINGVSNQLRAFQSTVGGVFINTTSVDGSAILQADSTTQGFLPPRMTTAQKNAIASPTAGLQVYDTTLNLMSYFNGTIWI